MFADRYIERNIIYPSFISHEAVNELGIIVVIPCYREPAILPTLMSLADCQGPSCSVEVIVVVNQSEADQQAITDINQATIEEVQKWEQENPQLLFKLFIIEPPAFPKKYAGAGMARKAGMDEAIRRFQSIDQPEGIIVSLDADTTVEPNYLTSIEQFYQQHPQAVGATLQFTHRINRPTMSTKQIEGIGFYERYLHYYKNALAFTGYPFPIFTIGSAFCCRAEAYVKQGGMNRKQAGEDFYFLHKLSQVGRIGEITTSSVHPLARLSDRVPFGTGPILQRWLEGKEDLTLTYNLQAFIDLKMFFAQTDQLFRIGASDYLLLIKSLASPLQQFLQVTNFNSDLQVIKRHTSQARSFRKRFFQVFDAFKILKYIHYSHKYFYQQQKLRDAEDQLLELANKNNL